MEGKLFLKTTKQLHHKAGYLLVELLLTLMIIFALSFISLKTISNSNNNVLKKHIIEATVIATQLKAIAFNETIPVPFLINQKLVHFNQRGNVSQAIKGKIFYMNAWYDMTIWLGFGRFTIE